MIKKLSYLFLVILTINSISALGLGFNFSTSGGNIILTSSLLQGTKLNCSDIIGGDDANFCSDATGAGGTDTNASTACSGAEYLAGNGSCLNVSDIGGDTTLSQEEVEDYVGGMTNGSLDYDDSNGILFINYTWFSNLFDTLFGNKDTDDLSEGSTNLYDNESWNESYADTLYADISVVDTNETTRVNTMVGTNCGTGNYSYGFDASGNIQCRADTTGGAGGNPFDQSLNTTEDVTFTGINLVKAVEGTPIDLLFNFSNGNNFTIRYTSGDLVGFLYGSIYAFDSNVAVDGDMNATGVVCDGSGNCLNSVGGSDVNKTYVDAQDSAQDECSEITGCVENAVTNATMNKTVDCSDIVGGSDGDYCSDATGAGDAGYYNSSRINITQFEDTGGTLHLLDSWINTLIDNRVTQAFVSALGFYTDTEIDSFGYFNATDEGNLNVNSSGFWDNLDSPSDINAGDITDDGTYLTAYTETDPAWTGNETNVAFKNEENTFTANQNLNNYNVTSVQCVTFNNGASWCGV